eukprot:TRINITY_DN7535_c1_g2_i1.p1 TRINITY_DN7535_c1_g2~~TRINITY_DN7535_c1_g2_i1.p1  ORF type:complete len:536 (+),score=162.62 TRINITY_DN7535_c1_g2_i1:139-1746(+)
MTVSPSRTPDDPVPPVTAKTSSSVVPSADGESVGDSVGRRDCSDGVVEKKRLAGEEGCDSDDADADADEAAPKASGYTRQEKKMLLVAWSILFIRYGASTFLSPFFPNVCDDLGIDGTMEGLIFAGYPAGIALVSPFAPRLIFKMGTRTAIIFGLLVTSVFTIAFGFVPDVVSDKDSKTWLWLLFYTLSGALGTLADTTCIVLLSATFSENIGKVMGVSNTVMGVGCMAGPALGGPLHDLTHSETWNFRLPFLIVGAMPALLMLGIILEGAGPHAAIPQRTLNTEEEKAPFKDVLTPSVFFASLALFMSGMIVATLDPTLEYRLSPPLSDSEVSAFFTGSSVVYALCCPFVGWLCDGRARGDSRVYKLIQAGGLLFLAVSFFLMGPWKLAGYEFTALDHVWVVAVGMFVKGIGSAGNNAAYNDMEMDCNQEKPMEKATIGGIWNAVYAVGWAAGPVVGGGLYSLFGSGRDGFQGMATVSAVGCVAVGGVTAAAAFVRCCNGGFRGPKRYTALSTLNDRVVDAEDPDVLCDDEPAP